MWFSGLAELCKCACLLQDLASAERAKKQAQTENEELRDEINSINTKMCVDSDTVLL